MNASAETRLCQECHTPLAPDAGPRVVLHEACKAERVRQRDRKRSHVANARPKARTVSLRVDRRKLAAEGRLFPEDPGPLPPTRSDCVDGPRPCPRVSCRFHLYLDVSARNGSVKLNFPGTEVEDLTESCSLDIADRGGIPLEEVGEILGLTRERIHQIELLAMAKVLDAAPELRDQLDQPGSTRRLPVLQENDADVVRATRLRALEKALEAKSRQRAINPLTGEGEGTVYDRILTVFVEAGRDLTVDDLEPLGITRRNLSIHLSMLTTRGRLDRVERGHYCLRAVGSEAQGRAAE